MSIKVLIVDDSATAREMIKQALEKDNEIEVIATAPDAFVARDLIVKLRPDVICLDVEMPKMDGITFLRKIMTHLPMPIVMVSSLTTKGAKTTLDALSFGAFDFVAKPHSNIYSGIDSMENELISKVKQASYANPLQLQNTLKKTLSKEPIKVYNLSTTTQKIVAIGASTGGTTALQTLLQRLPKNFPGIVVVQHMPGTFTNKFATRLNEICQLDIKEAEDGDKILTGQALIASGNYHLKVVRRGGFYHVEFGDEEKVSGHKPSVDILFDSVASSASSNAIGVILTGMGKDGANGITNMHNKSAVTIAQDEKTSVVFGMPKVAIEKGGIDYILPLDNIAKKLISILNK
jgi:two-component system chemotaxis response regulator CheB